MNASTIYDQVVARMQRARPWGWSAARRRGPLVALLLFAQAVGAARVPPVAAAAASQAAGPVPAILADEPDPDAGRFTISRNDDGTWTYHVTNGAGDGASSRQPFPLAYLEVRAGDTVTWTNERPGQSYTVTFPDANGLYPDPSSQDGRSPLGGPSYDGSTIASSGVLTPVGVPGIHSYSLTFTTQAVFQYRNLLDRDPNHVGVISVMAMYWAALPGAP